MRVVLFCWLLLIKSVYASEEPISITLYTEHMPPYSYLEDGQVSGINVELMQQLCQRQKLDCQITLLPWPRAYENAQRHQMSGVFSTSRSAARESMFQWVGPIASDWGYLFRLKGRHDVNPGNLEEAKNYKLAIARGDVYENYFLNLGFEYGLNMLDFATKSEPLRLLMAHRIDLVVGSKRSLRSWLREQQLPEDSAEPIIILQDVGDNYLALNRAFPPELAERMQQELELMQQQGVIDLLIAQYAGQ
ncbi:substrate-binding periplasmic protein [Arsukibacterium perlucidum]|uniref:substrate-binding periplasmic protein n=1 Tax=Arsukibacterium perlucidum TaxID=368811 RepID=UPI0003A41A55|nr:transporter substrate-binding domain-containing protein [Arsukibacterium perlucidum]